MKSLHNKTVLVTGAAGGFGQAFTTQLIQLGAHVLITDRDAKVLEQLMTESHPGPGKIIGAFAADLSTREGCLSCFEKAIAIAPEIDYLINNAGLITYGYFDETPLEKIDLLMQVNVLAPLYLSHAFINQYKTRGSGHIVTISSVSGFVGTAQSLAYGASKFAMRGFGMSLQKEVKRYNMQVSNVYPFYSKTGLLNEAPVGNSTVSSLPGFLYDSPDTIVKATIKGMRKNKLHIYPGIISPLIYFASRFWPIVGKMSN